MSKVLITGGSGTVGKAIIRRFRDGLKFAVLSRNEKLQHELRMAFPDVECYLGEIEDASAVLSVYDKLRPDVVIHAAALKHVDVAEKQPMQTCRVNIQGSINVIRASIEFRTPITVAISTDKACEHQNVYGMSKYLMERCFLEANAPDTRFTVCRFGNVAHSNGSVIPLWLEKARKGEALKITDPKMNRLMFSQDEAAELVMKAIQMSSASGGFILSKKMKSVNIHRLATAISNSVEIIGARAGEKIDEDLIAAKELQFTEVLDGGYVRINLKPNENETTRLRVPYNTLTAEPMSDEEIRKLVFGSSL